MSKNFTLRLVLALSIACGLLGEEVQGRLRESGSEAEPLTLTVRLYDYVDIAPEIRDRALSGTSDILRRAGIDAQFLNCHATTAQPVVNEACNARLKPWHLVARIVPPTMHPKVNRPTDTYGIARTTPGKNSQFLWVLYGNVERLAFERRRGTSYTMVHRAMSHKSYVGLLLAHVLAHEIGHLLLGTSEHSDVGLMSAQWSAEDQAQAVTGHLRFQGKEIQEIHRNLIHRHSTVDKQRVSHRQR